MNSISFIRPCTAKRADVFKILKYARLTRKWVQMDSEICAFNARLTRRCVQNSEICAFNARYMRRWIQMDSEICAFNARLTRRCIQNSEICAFNAQMYSKF